MAKDYYETLGVEKGATKEQIKKAYKKLAMKYHPDRTEEANKKKYEEKFKEINEAASVLGNEEKRANYDQFGSAEPQSRGFNSSNYGGGGNFGFEDIFSNIFGGGEGFFNGGRRRPRKGSDLYVEVEISLENAAKGLKRNIRIGKQDTCDKCRGNGADSKEDIKTCDVCNGSGVTTQAQRTPFGIFSTRTRCRKCNGKGKIITKKCSKCNGLGRVKVEKNIEVKIPAGIDNGFKLRLGGEGEAGENGLTGDLYVHVVVDDHEIFNRKGDDLYVEVPLSFSEAALGSSIEVKTIDGKAKLKIPENTQTHTLFKMKGKGIKHINRHGQGDQYVRVVVKTPDKISKKEKDLFKSLEKESKKKGFFEKVRGRLFN